jgi:hypothetical protein
MGLLGAGQLAVTIANIPQVEKLWQGLNYLLERLGVRRLDEELDEHIPEDRDPTSEDGEP